ncbi:MAG: NAD-dependent epimerase/dehydratase family protein [Anaerolineaceae bacterium]|nr:NAD-dependent epimerase/dehydratase family protein [Anaerolineaceae bacterium]
MNILIIGGTRNVGHMLALTLLEAGHAVTVFNRGRTRDDLPAAVTRVRGDRNAPDGLEPALALADHDAVVDMVLYDGAQARRSIAQLAGRTGHYVFISTGQVYLVREGLQRPFHEDDYDLGSAMPEPTPGSFDHEEWLYGVEKREAEDLLARAWQERALPVSTLRLPMVNSARDHFLRLYSYLLRLRDGGPVLVPDAPQYPLRHVYAADVVQAILALLARGPGRGEVFNISQDETVSLADWLALLAEVAGLRPAPLVKVPRAELEGAGLLPGCSPFSETWMSELDNARSVAELGMRYTPLAACLADIVRQVERQAPPAPPSYARRGDELALARQQ